MDEKYFPEKIEEKWQQRWEETRVVELEQVALRDRARVVDQDVDRACLRDHGLARLGPREVGRLNVHRHIIPRPNLVARALEVGGGARHEEQAASFAREFLPDRPEERRVGK